MRDGLRSVLDGLRVRLGRRAEQAYARRDERGATDQARDQATGEAHAYGVAEMDVRDAQRADDA